MTITTTITGTFKSVGPNDDDAAWGRIVSGIDTPVWDADMSHWLRFDVDPPPITYPDSIAQRPKKVQPKVRRIRWWKNPRVFFNSSYKCSASNSVVSGEINNEV
jgi:hypothetical protein